MRRKIPSTAALAAFEAAARHQSFTRAAEDLALSQSAVCRQIASLEHYVGCALFRRSGRGVALTHAGQKYFAAVSRRLDGLEQDTMALLSRQTTVQRVELAVVPTFATKWLLPRWKSLHRACPTLVLNMGVRTRPFLFNDTEFDAAIHSDDAGWPGTEAVFLMRENLIVVGSPSLLVGRRSLKPRDVARMPLLQSKTRLAAWRQWFEVHGLTVANDMAGPRFELFSMVVEAAARGVGLALVPKFLVEDELAAGRLAQLVEGTVRSDRSYYLIYPESNADNAAVTQLKNWLLEETRQYAATAR